LIEAVRDFPFTYDGVRTWRSTPINTTDDPDAIRLTSIAEYELAHVCLSNHVGRQGQVSPKPESKLTTDDVAREVPPDGIYASVSAANKKAAEAMGKYS
jgi:hypothetical protein